MIYLFNKWIKKNYPTKKSCINNCQKACIDMMVFFNGIHDFGMDEDTKDYLFLRVGFCNNIYHCWLVDKDDNIVDPTKKQFSGSLNYTVVTDRFLEKDEIDVSTGAIFLKNSVID